MLKGNKGIFGEHRTCFVPLHQDIINTSISLALKDAFNVVTAFSFVVDYLAESTGRLKVMCTWQFMLHWHTSSESKLEEPSRKKQARHVNVLQIIYKSNKKLINVRHP